MSRSKSVLKILRSELEPSFGCTEPVAVGLATSIAYNAAKGSLPSWLHVQLTPVTVLDDITQESIERIVIDLDRFTYRNGLDVEIPGTGKRGSLVAAALGVFCNPNKRLSIFEDSETENLQRIEALLEADRVRLNILNRKASSIYIKAKVLTKRLNGFSNEGIAIIEDSHTNVTSVKRNGRVLYKKENRDHKELCKNMKILAATGLEEIIDTVKKLPEEYQDLIRKSMRMNLSAAKVGISKKPGLKVGYTLKRLRDEKILGNDMINHAIALTSAAVDTRMSGQIVPVMSCAGSGNQGLTATLPIMAVAERQGWNEDRVVRAVALSYLITCYCTSHLGYLSTLCGGAIKAGVGAAAGIAYYLGGELQQVDSAMKNMMESITGLICDGAKTSCAIKLTVVSGAAVESALLALNSVTTPSQSGINGKNLEETIQNIKRISESMTETNEAILEIISGK